MQTGSDQAKFPLQFAEIKAIFAVNLVRIAAGPYPLTQQATRKKPMIVLLGLATIAAIDCLIFSCIVIPQDS
ncbi:hypothetical protein [Marinovum sp.]|uniref:hypothetical protein n=1 Tax=Marinovum sp. TaxID=2024839 RepID=UPI003A956415